MKRIPAFSTAAVLALSACDTMNRPLTSGDFDPLRPPGSDLGSVSANSQGFSAGQFVRASMDNAAFFSSRPRGDVDADKLLRKGTSMKVISTTDSYTKVELDSGEVGWVPTILLEDPNAPQNPYGVNPGEYQVYPPPGAFDATLPPTAPADLPPGGAIPTVIDPEAPSTIAPLPPGGTPAVPVVPAPGTAPLPPSAPAPLPPSSPAPLPPNGEEEDTPVEVTPKLEE